MKEKELLETLDMSELEEDYVEDAEYPSWKESKRSVLREDVRKKRNRTFMLLGAGLVVLIVLVAVFILRTDNGAGSNQIRSLEGRLKQLENRLVKLQGVDQRLAQLEVGLVKLEEIDERLARVEQQGKKVEVLRQRFGRSEGAGTLKTTGGPAEQTGAQYHVVRAGETLYRISLRYGLKVDELLRLNNLASGATIYPGQRILVRPAANM